MRARARARLVFTFLYFRFLIRRRHFAREAHEIAANELATLATSIRPAARTETSAFVATSTSAQLAAEPAAEPVAEPQEVEVEVEVEVDVDREYVQVGAFPHLQVQLGCMGIVRPSTLSIICCPLIFLATNNATTVAHYDEAMHLWSTCFSGWHNWVTAVRSHVQTKRTGYARVQFEPPVSHCELFVGRADLGCCAYYQASLQVSITSGIESVLLSNLSPSNLNLLTQ